MDTSTALRPIRRILVGQRPDDNRRDALDLALVIAPSLRAQVRVVEVVPRYPLFDRLGIEDPGWSSNAHFEASRSPAELADLHGFPADLLEVATKTGRARDVLLAEAEGWGADLVVIGRPAVETLPRILLGTVTDSLVRHLSCPLLVARGSQFPPRQALFPVDLSPSSAEAAACGLALLRQTKAKETLCRALLVLPSGVDKVAATTAENVLAGFVADLAEEGDVIAGDLSFGEAAPTILETARERGTDLIVLGTHGDGIGPIERHKIGSVVAPVLFDPPCNVLIVPPAAQLGAALAEAVVSATAPGFSDG